LVDAGIFDGDTVIVEQALPRDGDIVAALYRRETTPQAFCVNKPAARPTSRRKPRLPFCSIGERTGESGRGEGLVRQL
jgi:hypothetical protein